MLLLRKCAAKYTKMINARGPANSSVNLPAARHSLKGSSKHAYYSMAYDATETDVEVKGVLRLPASVDGAFRYTSVTTYAYTSLPLAQYFDGATLTPDAGNADGSQPFTVRLTTTPSGRPNEVDVSESPTGVCVVRIVYPTSDEVVAACKPSIKTTPPRRQDVFEAKLPKPWKTFFACAGVANLLQAALHFSTAWYGSGSAMNALLGFTPAMVPALLTTLGLCGLVPYLPAWYVAGNDALIWTVVALAGVAYYVHGTSLFGLPPAAMAIFGLLKYQVAGTLYLLYFAGTPGSGTLLIAMMESVLGSAFLVWSLLVATSPAGQPSVVRLRNAWHLLNALDPQAKLIKFPAAKLKEKHDAVLEAEKAAFGDSPASTAAKRALFDIQCDGVTGEGNKFTAAGRLMLGKDIAKRLDRRMRFAKLLTDNAELKAKSQRPIVSPVIIAGLPRTGSTFLHRLLAADPSTRSPLWWEQMHNDEDVTPPDEANLLTDPRIGPVAKAFDAVKAISPNAVKEFYKFHRMEATDVEECAPFLRRYFWDMEGASISADALAKRTAWLQSEQVDRSFLATELRAWLALHGSEASNSNWVLKAPLFTAFLWELAAAFPDAAFVFTSRDPIQMMPSTCGMAEAFAGLQMRYDDGLAVLGKAIASRMHQYATSQLAFCKTPPKGLKKPITLRYKEVLAKPMDAVRDIYKATGRPLSDAVVQTMAAHLAANKQHKEGRPDYSLAKFGLDKAEQEALFKEYIAIC